MKVTYQKQKGCLFISSSVSEQAFDLGKTYEQMLADGYEVYEDNRGFLVQLKKELPQDNMKITTLRKGFTG